MCVCVRESKGVKKITEPRENARVEERERKVRRDLKKSASEKNKTTEAKKKTTKCTNEH